MARELVEEMKNGEVEWVHWLLSLFCVGKRVTLKG